MSDDHDSDREAILRRRHRLIGVALAGLTVSASATASACLRVAVHTDAGVDAGPQVCLAPKPEDAGPLDGGTLDDAGFDAGEPIPDDAGTGEA